MSDAVLRDHEERIKRLEELLLPKRPKPKRGRRRRGDPKFARNLKKSMEEKGFNQSDLAARVFEGYKTSSEGKKVAKGKDRISRWVNGHEFPSDKYLALLAQFVDVV
jgi:chemotaxis receptor (MCP) glutamine deamidase CheD